jgi:hypothetical protein
LKKVKIKKEVWIGLLAFFLKVHLKPYEDSKYMKPPRFG